MKTWYKDLTIQEISSCSDGRPFGHSSLDMGGKVGATVPLYVGEVGPHLTLSLRPYQVAS